MGAMAEEGIDMSLRRRHWRVAWLVVASSLCLLFGTQPVMAGGVELSADVDGRPIALNAIPKYHCQDLDYPRIHCFRTPAALEASAANLLAATASAYVYAWDQPSYAGGSFIFTQDYLALATIAWNDRISSFKAKNSDTGHWYTDWFYGGTSWYFCCNVQQPFLGSFDDTFSSVHRL